MGFPLSTTSAAEVKRNRVWGLPRKKQEITRDFTHVQSQLTDYACVHVCAYLYYVYVCAYVFVSTCRCKGFLIIYMTNITTFFFFNISIKRFLTALGCLLFLSGDIGQKADNASCLARLRCVMLTCILAK